MKDNNYGYYTDNTYSLQPIESKPKKRGGSGKKIVAVAICCSLLGGSLGTAGTLAGLKYFASDGFTSVSAHSEKDDNASDRSDTYLLSADRDNTAVSTAKVNTGKLLTAAEVYEQNVRSTVGITTEINTNYFGYQTTAAAAGSGFFITTDGYILTNYHVIEGASSITVTDYDGNTYDAELVGSDSSNDLAVLKISADGLPPVVLGSSDDLSVGDEVAAIGNPLGELTFSLTQGVVSALDREVTTEAATMNLIQTDCAINSGNSGGALFNMYGEVIGITNAKYSSGSSDEASIDNIGFAIPIDSVKGIFTSIIEKGYVTKPYVGVSIADVSEDAAQYGVPEGASVKAVTDGAPAAKAGVEVGDVIVEANGKAVSGSSDFIAVVRSSKDGDELTLKVYRQGEYKTVKLTVEETKQDDTAAQQEDQKQSGENNGRRGYENYGDFGDFFGYGDMFGY